METSEVPYDNNFNAKILAGKTEIINFLCKFQNYRPIKKALK
jgi:hypothetical protein